MACVQVQGTQFVVNESPIRFRGLGVGSWLNMEHFMLGIPTPDKQIREAFAEVFGEVRGAQFFHDLILKFCSEADFQFLQDMGINLIRVPFNYRLFVDDVTGAWKQEGFDCFDRLFALCTKYRIYVLPDLHTVPGGQNPDWHADNQTGIPEFWHYRVFQDQMVGFWQNFARRYANEPYLLGYDLLNEPFLIPESPGVLQTFYQQVTKAIRKVDSHHIIFLEGDYFAMDFSAIQQIFDEQTALTFHFYPTVWEQNLCDLAYPRDQRKKTFEQRFAQILDGISRFQRPLLCGEAGYDIAGHSLPHVLEMVEDTLNLFERYEISWTLWCYKDAQFMGVVYPKNDSPWMQFAKEIRQQWTHYQEMEMAQQLVDQMCAHFPKEASEELKYQLQFRQRGLLYTLQKELILKPQLQRWGWERVQEFPVSFSMEHCEYYKPYVDLLKTYTTM